MNDAFPDFLKKTMYSVKQALGDVNSIIPVLKERGQKYLPIADLGEVSEWVSQYFTCKDNDIIPILGMETFVNNYRFRTDKNGNQFIKKLGETETWEQSVRDVSDNEKDWSQIDFPLDIYAITIDGYYNIIKIHNDAQINGVDKRPRTSDYFLKKHGKGVIAVFNVPYGEIPSFIYNGLIKEAEDKLAFYRSVFDDVYMGVPIVESESYREINKEIILFCKKNNLKMIPVTNTHYDKKEDGETFPVFQKCGKLRGGFFYEEDICPNAYYKSRTEVWETFKKYHESDVFTELEMQLMFISLENLCSRFTLLDLDTSPKMPKFPNSGEKLTELAWKGMERLGYKGKPEYEERMNYELEQVIGAGFADYFLMLEDLFDWHINKQHKIPSVGRGSSAASLILNCLNITHIDPLKYHLPFDRFLSADRLKDIVKSGGKVSGCFKGDTIVKMNNGMKAISLIQPGDIVETIDGTFREVRKVWKHGIKSFDRMIYEKNGKQYELYVTGNHIFPVKGWLGLLIEKPLDEIEKYTEFINCKDKNTHLVSVEKNAVSGEAYDLEIENKHYYRVCGVRVK